MPAALCIHTATFHFCEVRTVESPQLLSPVPSPTGLPAGSLSNSAPSNGAYRAAEGAIAPHTILVCTTCASTWQNGQRVGTSGGEKLFDRLQAHLEAHPNAAIALVPTSCMSACSHACAVAFAAAGKHSYLFGDLPHDEAGLPQTVAAIATCAQLYADRPDGLLAWGERPEPLKNGVLARIPPVAAVAVRQDG